jgi:glycolate oxidase iron-sulfur subunit
MARAVEACVHCGFCLPACPTYRVLGEEMDSPRGRILLMKAGLVGTVAVAETLPFIDRCLGCLACVPACPSGVAYGELLPRYRDHASGARRGVLRRIVHAAAQRTLPSRTLARLAFTAARLARPVAPLLPASLRAMLTLAPATLLPARPLPPFTPAEGPRRARVALLEGCVQSVIAPEIGWATLRVLARNDVEVVVARQDCCGALALHGGELSRARQLATAWMDGLPADVDAIVTNAAGCGSALKEYGPLFHGEPGEPRASAVAARVRDVSEFLRDLGMWDPPALGGPLTVAYHDACHLAHAQRITAAPRELLARIGGLTVVEVEEGEVCCGSAGTYNVEQPAIADALGERKARHILATGATAAVTGNIGCIVQIRSHLARQGRTLPVWHTIELLDRAYASRS